MIITRKIVKQPDHKPLGEAIRLIFDGFVAPDGNEYFHQEYLGRLGLRPLYEMEFSLDETINDATRHFISIFNERFKTNISDLNILHITTQTELEVRDIDNHKKNSQ